MPPRTFGEALNVLSRTAQQCGEHKTSTARRVELDEWVRVGFKDAEAAEQFRAEADRIVPGLVEPPVEARQR